jgi:hypothetical protein
MAFVRRRINVTLSLGQGNFGDSGKSNTVELKGLRVSANIQKGNSPGFDWAEVSIYGVTQSLMNTASLLGAPLSVTRNNGLEIEAGDDVAGMALVFRGTIQHCSQNFQAAPDVCLVVGAQGGGLGAMAPVTPTSFPGVVDAATIFTTIAAKMQPNPLTLENAGVTAQVADQYLSGTTTAQIDELKEAADCYARVEDENSTLVIWPKGGSRSGKVPLISSATGMVGVPSFADKGINLRSLYFGGVRVGGLVQVESKVVPNVTGQWRVNTLSYELDSETPGGNWFMNIVGSRVDDGASQ